MLVKSHVLGLTFQDLRISLQTLSVQRELCKSEWKAFGAGGRDNPINSSTGFMRNIADKGIKWHVVVIMFYNVLQTWWINWKPAGLAGFHQFRRSSMG